MAPTVEMGTGMAGGDRPPVTWLSGDRISPLCTARQSTSATRAGIPSRFPPAITQAGLTAHDPTFVIIACLSCHDGNLARPGMMKGSTVETLPVVGGNAPTFLGSDGSTAGNYNNDHPVGPNATFGCGPPYNWDCTINASSNSITWRTHQHGLRQHQLCVPRLVGMGRRRPGGHLHHLPRSAQ